MVVYCCLLPLHIHHVFSAPHIAHISEVGKFRVNPRFHPTLTREFPTSELARMGAGMLVNHVWDEDEVNATGDGSRGGDDADADW